MKIIGLLITSFFILGANASTETSFKNTGTWTGNNNSSSAPTPYCSCDKNENTQDCPSEFVDTYLASDICYDEYIPEGSRGWVHARVFKRGDVLVKEGLWTGNNNSSSAPTPYCSCDNNENTQDCPKEFIETSLTPDVCYDEYIPKGSRGWVHAIIYRKK